MKLIDDVDADDGVAVVVVDAAFVDACNVVVVVVVVDGAGASGAPKFATS